MLTTLVVIAKICGVVENDVHTGKPTSEGAYIVYVSFHHFKCMGGKLLFRFTPGSDQGPNCDSLFDQSSYQIIAEYT